MSPEDWLLLLGAVFVTGVAGTTEPGLNHLGFLSPRSMSTPPSESIDPRLTVTTEARLDGTRARPPNHLPSPDSPSRPFMSCPKLISVLVFYIAGEAGYLLEANALKDPRINPVNILVSLGRHPEFQRCRWEEGWTPGMLTSVELWQLMFKPSSSAFPLMQASGVLNHRGIVPNLYSSKALQNLFLDEFLMSGLKFADGFGNWLWHTFFQAAPMNPLKLNCKAIFAKILEKGPAVNLRKCFRLHWLQSLC